MSTTSTEVPDFGATYLPMSKNAPPMYINGPSVSNTTTHQLPNGYATTNGYTPNSGTEFTNLTPMLAGPAGFNAQAIIANTSFANDSSNPSSASSSRIKLETIGCDDSGISSHNGSLLMSSNHQQMNGFGSPQMEVKVEDDLDAMPRDRRNTCKFIKII